MISFIMPARNARDWTVWALMSLHNAIDNLQWRDHAQVILLDDASDPGLGILPAFQEFRQKSGLPTTIIRFKQQQHYSRVLSAGLSLSRGEKVFFLSNDMVFTPTYFKMLMDVSNADASIGIVRGTSNYTDSHAEHTVNPPFAMRSFEDILNFSAYVSFYWQHHFVQDGVLSADAVLFNRPLINKIGVVDTRYFGYFGDVDYGLRAIRSGFKLVCAKGAWLLHHGAGYVKDEAARANADLRERHARRMEVVQAAYTLFRAKWDPAGLPEKVEESQMPYDSLKILQPMDLHQYIAPSEPAADLIEML